MTSSFAKIVLSSTEVILNSLDLFNTLLTLNPIRFLFDFFLVSQIIPLFCFELFCFQEKRIWLKEWRVFTTVKFWRRRWVILNYQGSLQIRISLSQRNLIISMRKKNKQKIKIFITTWEIIIHKTMLQLKQWFINTAISFSFRDSSFESSVDLTSLIGKVVCHLSI